MNLIRRGMALHRRRLATVASEKITIRYGEHVAQCDAIPGQSLTEETLTQGDGSIETQTDDWLIDRDQLHFDGSEFLPARGYVIEASAGRVYDVMPGSNGKTWSWADTTKTLVRIHTVNRGERS